jgi:integrase/recombinase XerD
MAVDGSGRVHLLGSVQLLHPEQQTFDQMLDGGTSSCLAI